MGDPSEDDAFLESQVARALLPYRDKGFVPEVLEEMEALVRLAFLSDPTMQRHLDALRPRAAVNESAEVEVTNRAERVAKSRFAKRGANPKK